MKPIGSVKMTLIMLRRNSQCDAMALQNRLFRQKFFPDIAKAYDRFFKME